MIRDSAIPAHAPIEQRWTATSAAAMSPASAADPKTIHSWVRTDTTPTRGRRPGTACGRGDGHSVPPISSVLRAGRRQRL